MTHDERETPLESWKEIAAYLKRDVTTVRRWEKQQGLPVHRHLHEARSSVFAYRSELDVWWAGRTPAEQTQEAGAPPRRLRPLAFAAALLLAAATSGDGLARPMQTVAQAQGLTARQVWSGRAVDTTGDVTPDGRLLSFVDWETGDLAVRDLTSSVTRKVTNKGTWTDSFEFALFSAFSPDASRVAYGWFTKAMTWELRTVPIDGGEARVVYADPGVIYMQPSSWTPDGTRVLSLLTRSDGSNQIALVSAADGSTRVVKRLDWRFPIAPALSPDGGFVAFDLQPSTASAQRDIYVVSTDGAKEVPLVQHPANDYLPVWAPDGSSVFFLSDRAGAVGLWTLPVAQGAPAGPPRLVKGDIGRVSAMRFDRRGSLHYALETGMTDVYVASVDFSAGIVIDQPAALSQSFVGANRGADWSPDGSQVAYLSQRLTGPTAARSASIVIRTVDSGAERMLTTGLTRISRPRWSPDGRRLLVYAHDSAGQRGMFGVDPRTGAASMLFELPSESYVPSPTWSADGRSVIYTYPKDGGFMLRARDLASGAERILFRDNAQNMTPSPDGRSIAFTYATGKDVSESRLVVMPVEGGEPRLVTATRHPETMALDSVTWTADGKQLLYATRGDGGNGSLWRVPVAGGEPQKLPVPVQGAFVSLRVHPDGRRILFTSGERSSEIWVLENLLPTR